MKQIFISILLFALTGFAAHVAVLETIGAPKTLDLSERQYLTDKLRQIAVTSLSNDKGFTIMTRENINAMLPPGKSIEECEGSCLVETGKNISADYVAQARVSKFDKLLTITVELYETASGKLMASFTGESSNAKGLLNEIERKSGAFFSVINVNNDITKDRDGNIYKTIQIGNQTWMAENLNVTTKDSWCFENKLSNCVIYGRLYTWEAAKKSCPNGWHLPTKQEFDLLLYTIGGKKTAGNMLKSKYGWRDVYKKNIDHYGFSVLPAGVRNMDGKFFKASTAFWSSTEVERNYPYALHLTDDFEDVYLGFDNSIDNNWGFSVRCIKD